MRCFKVLPGKFSVETIKSLTPSISELSTTFT